MLLLLQFVILSGMILYFTQWRAYMHRRNLRSWDYLLAQTHSDSYSSEFSARLSSRQSHGRDFRGLWVLFRHARIALETMDYAERNSTADPSSIDPMLVAAIRADAMQTRISVLVALAKCALPNPAE